MIRDPNLEVITEELISKRGCHTVILYGSRARGEETATSDYDVLGIRESGDVFRDARPWRGSYLDIFVWPESKVVNPDETLVYLRQGVVLHEKGDIGTRFLARLAEIHKAGPKKLATDEISARKVWAQKMLDRARAGDIEGNYRRAWLLTSLLEDYFVLRGEWYPGAKEAFRWLKANQPEVHLIFEMALRPGSDVTTLAKLAEVVAP